VAVAISEGELEKTLEEYRTRALSGLDVARIHIISPGLCKLLREPQAVTDFVISIDVFITAVGDRIRSTNDVIGYSDRKVLGSIKQHLRPLQKEMQEHLLLIDMDARIKAEQSIKGSQE